jgi:hypothetical protein
VLKINLEVNQEYHIINIITHQTLIHAASAINSNKVAHVTWELKSEAEGRWNRVSLNFFLKKLITLNYFDILIGKIFFKN